MLARREFLAQATAAAAFGLLPRAHAEPAPPGPIDVHHHAAPPSYIADLKLRPQANDVLSGWSPEKSLADMDQSRVATAMISINNVWAGDNARAVRLARECNDYVAKMAQGHPGRFGRFAALPLPNVEASLKEIEYALDTLKTEGIGMMTSYGDKWLGHRDFLPVMEELNRRKAVVFTHPTTATCCGNLMPGITNATIEYGTDTTRTIASLLFGGTMKQCPDIRFIFSHAGGTMPYLIGRFEAQARDAKAMPDGGVVLNVKKHFYDIAQSANPITLGALTKLVPISQVLFGTDFPFTTAKEHLAGLAKCAFPEKDRRAIERDNAAKLFPTLKA